VARLFGGELLDVVAEIALGGFGSGAGEEQVTVHNAIRASLQRFPAAEEGAEGIAAHVGMTEAGLEAFVAEGVAGFHDLAAHLGINPHLMAACLAAADHGGVFEGVLIGGNRSDAGGEKSGGEPTRFFGVTGLVYLLVHYLVLSRALPVFVHSSRP